MRRPRGSTKQITPTERAELYRSALRGKRAKDLTQTDIWIREIVPFVQSEERDILDVKSFRPGRDVPSIERIALMDAYFSGKRDGLMLLLDKIETWIELGKSASVKIEAERKKER